jgi:hypothetical protein
MSTQEALDIFKILLTETIQKREIRIYNKFISLLSGLNKIALSKEQIQLIEQQLDDLKLKSRPANIRKFYNKKYAAFEQYLRTKHSLSTEGYYTAIGLSLGLSLGTGLGISFGAPFGDGVGISIGLSFGAGIGLIIGMLIGAHLDAEAKKNGKIIITKMDKQ